MINADNVTMRLFMYEDLENPMHRETSGVNVFSAPKSSRISSEERESVRFVKLRAGEIHPEVDRVFPDFQTKFAPATKSVHRELLSTAMWLKEDYNKINFTCFLSAAQAGRAPINWVIKEKEKCANPNRDVKCFAFFREPDISLVPIEDFLNASHISDHRRRQDLICADANFLHDTPGKNESAYQLCADNVSIHSIDKTSEARDLFKNIPSKIDQNALFDEFMGIAREFDVQDCGSLSVICIPNDKLKECVYRSHPYGEVCRCAPSEDDLAILQHFQNNTFSSNLPERSCWQYRIIASYIKPENNIRSFLLTPNAEATKECKRRIKELAKRIILAENKQPINVHLKAFGAIVSSFALYNTVCNLRRFF